MNEKKEMLKKLDDFATKVEIQEAHRAIYKGSSATLDSCFLRNDIGFKS